MEGHISWAVGMNSLSGHDGTHTHLCCAFLYLLFPTCMCACMHSSNTFLELLLCVKGSAKLWECKQSLLEELKAGGFPRKLFVRAFHAP